MFSKEHRTAVYRGDGIAALERKWREQWGASPDPGFVPAPERRDNFTIDAPIVTISGMLHLGSIFGTAHTDVIARFNRMRGRRVLFPVSWDDNGLPTERLVEQHFGVRCDLDLPYDPSFEPPGGESNTPAKCSRRNFLELCQELTAVRAAEFDEVWERYGFSVDWSQRFTSMDQRAQRTSQRAFLRDLAAGRCYQAEGPVYWDVTDRTAVAQAEIERRATAVDRHRLKFFEPGNSEEVPVATDRIELLPSIVAVLAPPTGPLSALVGTTLRCPLWGIEVPVITDARAAGNEELEVVPTFGSSRDVALWRQHSLPMRSIVDRDGRLVREAPDWLVGSARVDYEAIGGMSVDAARFSAFERLRDANGIVGEARAADVDLEYYERGDRPIEIVSTAQWYLRNGAYDTTTRHAVSRLGSECEWLPRKMRRRLDAWIDGIHGDWVVSRQRPLGVPIPVWYEIDPDGRVDRDRLLLPDESSLPVDPWSDTPPGYREDQRGEPGGFGAERDVMDTFLTSALTPQIVCHWEDDPTFFEAAFPMDLRTQGPEVIRTWTFYTLLRSLYLHDAKPWDAAVINGWVLSPGQRQDESGVSQTEANLKMSKSLGNIVSAQQAVDEFGADAVRYWACSSRPGTDVAFSVERVDLGRRLVRRLWRLSELGVRTEAARPDGSAMPPLHVIDRALLVRLVRVTDEATTALEGFRYSKALRHAAGFVEHLRSYVDVVGPRLNDFEASGDAGRASASLTLGTALSVTHRLLAPFLPFSMEEMWSWSHPTSVHAAPWPTAAELAPFDADTDDSVLDLCREALRAIRREKTRDRDVPHGSRHFAVLSGRDHEISALESVMDDLVRAGDLGGIELVEGPERSCRLSGEDEQAALA